MGLAEVLTSVGYWQPRWRSALSKCCLAQAEMIRWTNRLITGVSSYQMTMATIFRTASFKLWQKLTKALPLGPILPNIIPELQNQERNKNTDKQHTLHK